MAAKKPLTEEQKISILQRDAAGQTLFEIKKEMGIENGQQIGGFLNSQYTDTGKYLVKKAGLPGPTRPPKRARSDVQPADGAAVVESQAPSAIREALNSAPPRPAPEQVSAASEPLFTGGNPPSAVPAQFGPAPIQRFGVAPSSAAPANVVGFRRDGALEKFVVYRETPFKALVGTFTPPWDVSEIAPRYGDGDFLIERWIPGRMQPETMRLPVVGFGPPRVSQYEGQSMNGSMTPSEPPSVAMDKLLTAVKTGMDLAKPAPVAPVVETPVDKAVGAFVQKTLEKAMEPAVPPVQAQTSNDAFWQNWMRIREDERREERERREHERVENDERWKRERDEREVKHKREHDEQEAQYRREKEERDAKERREREEGTAEFNRRMQETDKKHAQEMERIKTDAEERRKTQEESDNRRHVQESEHAKAMAEIDGKKLDWAMKQSSRAVDEANASIADAETKLSKKIDDLNATATKERERDRVEAEKDRKHLMAEIDFQRQQLAIEKSFQEELLDIKKQQANANSDKLLELGEKVLQAFNDRAKDILEVKKAEAVLSNNPGLATAAMNNPSVMSHMASQRAPQNGGGKPSGDKEMASKLDAVADTQGFRDFMEEWCLHLEDNLDPEVLFDSIQRRYQQNDVAVGEVMDFMAGRRWDKAKAMIWQHLTPEQQATFQRENAKPYYEKIRAMVVLMKASAMKQWQKWEAERVELPQPPASTIPVPQQEEAVKEAETVEPTSGNPS